MSKLEGKLSYKDWCILKHALRDKVKAKEDELRSAAWTSLEVLGADKEKIQKELEEEKATLERITKLTNNFKRYIHGQERHYISRPYDCE